MTAKYALFILIFLIPITGRCQQILRPRSGELPVVCHAGNGIGHGTRVGPPRSFKLKNGDHARTASAVIIVDYYGFPPKAIQAFEYAKSIWESLITTPVVIRVAAVWTNLPEGTLGGAGPTFWAANFTGAPRINIYYPGPLAEKLGATDLNHPGEYDIVAQFNSSANWHFESTGAPAADEFDLATVALHELGHGLGFTATFDVYGGIGLYGAYRDSRMPFPFDLFLQTGTGVNLYESIVSPSSELGQQLTGNDLFYRSPYDAEIARIYAPGLFSEGSSISHFDPSSYPQGSENSLMRPFINPNEVNHDPGPMAQKIFSDIGWVTTYISHKNLLDREDVSTPIEVKALLTADGTPSYSFDSDRVTLTYTRSDLPGTVQAPMHPTGTPGEFSASLQAPLSDVVYSYHISVIDNRGRTLYSPGLLYDTAIANSRAPVVANYSVNVGADNTPPVISHRPRTFISYLDNELAIDVTIKESTGISGAQLEVILNDEPPQVLDLQLRSSGTGTFEGATYYYYHSKISFDPELLKDGDVVRYRILVTDDAVAKNEGTLPETGFFELPVRGLFPPRTYYLNDFDQPSDDFIGDDFSVRSDDKFNSPAIHSPHPYPEAGAGNTRNLTYQLRIPIIVSNTTSALTFDEVVIVEPGEEGSYFGDPEFYDYVIVEGSRDGGQSWLPLVTGYDSRQKPSWKYAYDRSIAGERYHLTKRSIDLRNTFESGEEVIIRFRLFSDPFGNGWGWAIDNLRIQVDDVKPEILHNHIDYAFVNSQTITFPASVSDNLLVDKVVFEYLLPGQPPERDTIAVSRREGLVGFSLDISALDSGSVISYRYEAIDSADNRSELPPQGYFAVPLIQFKDTVNQYNSSNAAPADFAGNFFGVTNFSNTLKIHSSHPYLPGFGTDHKSDFTLTLLKRIRVSDKNPFMRFDEIALVQPADNKAIFGTREFRDYVIVEGSKDGGKTWSALEDGYNARDGKGWPYAYTQGEPMSHLLYRRQTMDLTSSGDFVAGDVILIRFRLFSDESNTGWGWEIANLHIQDEVTGLEPDGPVSMLLIYPNPVIGDHSLIIEAQAPTNGAAVFVILDAHGTVVGKGNFPAGPGEAVVHSVPLDGYANGIYLLRMNFNGATITRKFMVAR